VGFDGACYIIQHSQPSLMVDVRRMVSRSSMDDPHVHLYMVKNPME
jgi:hypothetical protein